MTLNEIIKVVGGKTTINSELEINEIKTDSRNIKKGDIFIALKGKNYDGNKYINEALRKGAIACITINSINDKCIEVSDTYNSLFDIAYYLRNKYNIPLIGITGSNGKTTTKDLVFHILSSKYKVLKNEQNKNNLIGVSETLFKLNNSHEMIVMELGSNHMGEISYLSKMCKPDIALITNIGSSHLGYFKSRKNIFKEKSSIIDGMNNKKLIVNGDDKYLKRLDRFKCGLNSGNDLIAYNIYQDIDYISFNIYLDKEYQVIFNNPGKHFISDILLAIKVSLEYDIKIKTILKRIRTFKQTDKRMSLINSGSNIIINDCYNASYESVMGGLDYLNSIVGNKVLILGDILELGKYSKKIHKKINKKLKYVNKDLVITVGEYSKYINGIHFCNSSELIEYLKQNPIRNSYIYVKGSRRMNLDEIVEYLKM